MFQSFDDVSEPDASAPRVRRLRDLMHEEGLAALLVPRADAYQNEYVPPDAERLRWLTGFTGSAGMAAILRDGAALFVDGRYTLQARDQVDTGIFEICKVPDTRVSDWLSEHLGDGELCGYDPRLHTVREIERFEKALSERGAQLVATGRNLVDAIWRDRPAQPPAPLRLHPISHAGVGAAQKIADLQDTLRQAKLDAALLTSPEAVCWMLNIRGSDVAHTPLVLCSAILHAEQPPELFIDDAKLDDESRGYLAPLTIFHEPAAMAERLASLGGGGAKVRLDPDRAARWFADRLTEAGAEIVHGPDPTLRPKARKNETEIAGAHSAHIRDGAAMCRFLAWLDAAAPGDGIDEIAVARKLEALRAETGALVDISFDTISGAGPNGAIVHYRVTEASNRRLEPNSLYLVDSGAQYLDGTTDITRTVAIGAPDAEMRRHFTLVLKGHIAIATTRFPKGTRGLDIDAFARRALWAAGLDYDHGTGHGVGSFLSVHEGPQGISRRSKAELEPGMICSNEPGYYREGQYGIRIENLVLVTEPEAIPGGERDMLGFAQLTRAPFDLRLVDRSLLTKAEAAWLDDYHAWVRDELAPHLDHETAEWLDRTTKLTSA